MVDDGDARVKAHRAVGAKEDAKCEVEALMLEPATAHATATHERHKHIGRQQAAHIM